MGKISKKYIGTDQVGASQIELENDSALRAKDSLGVSQNLMELDPSSLLQMLKHPYLPGAATAPDQAARQAEVTAAQSAADAAQIDATQALSDASDAQADATQALSDAAAAQSSANAAQSDATQALSDAAAAQSDATQALSDAAAAQADVDALEPQVSTLQDEMDVVQEQNSVREVVSYNSFASIYADGQPGILDPKSTTNPRPGWYFQNDTASEKINWYYFLGSNDANGIQLQNFSGYAIMQFDSVSPLKAPIMAVYTFPTGSGDARPSFAHSVVVYSAPMSITPVVGVQYLVYFGQNPAAHPELPRIQLSYVAAQSAGDQGPTELVFTSSFGSDSSAGVNTVQYMVEKLGVSSPSLRGDNILEIRPAFRQLDGSVDMLAAKITNLADPTLAQDAVTKSFMDSAISVLSGDISDLQTDVSTLQGDVSTLQGDVSDLETNKANKSLNNLDAITAIPSTVTDLQSENTSQVFASEFKIDTKSQTVSNSGSIRLLSGNVSGDFLSGGARVASGNSTNAARPSATNTATGSASIFSGDISGGTLGSTGGANLLTGLITSPSVTGNTGLITVRSGNNFGVGSTGRLFMETGFSINSAGGRSGGVTLGSGKALNAVSGDVFIYSGYIGTGLGFDNSANVNNTGYIMIESGPTVNAGTSGALLLRTGDNTGSGSSGDISITSGSVVSGVRGKVSITSRIVEVNSQLDMQANKIIDLADPTSAQDAATKAYVDAQISSGTDFHKQAITLSATDITNQYVDLSVQAIAQSCNIFVGERVALFESLDYSISIVGGVTRVSFSGPSASGGAEELVAGQVLYIQCVIE